MIKIEDTQVYGWQAAINGMRNPLASWHKSDTNWLKYYSGGNINRCIGENDLSLMKRLSKAGSDHAKFLRMINVTCDITAPQFWWFEADTYKVGTVRNSCSKMHKIHVAPFKWDDFSHEGVDEVSKDYAQIEDYFNMMVNTVEWLRNQFNETQDKKYWRALIEILPEGYNMRATIQLNYQVLKNMYFARRNHKLTEWHDFCDWCKSLPYFEEICIQGE